MKPLIIAVLFPEITNINGDAENARVLAQRARWGGSNAEIITIPDETSFAEAMPDVVIVGSTAESNISTLITQLWTHSTHLTQWVNSGVALLAIGTGWEALCAHIDLSPTQSVDGAGIFPGRAVWNSSRVSDDLIVESPFGRLVGYENHCRAYVPSQEEKPLGRVLYGTGNGMGSTFEGTLVGTAIGTHLHGPVLAKNPALADHFLIQAFAHAVHQNNPGDTLPKLDTPTEETGVKKSVHTERVDAIAHEANARILSRLHIL